MKRRIILTWPAAWLATANAAHAAGDAEVAAPRRYAALSLIGDKVSVITDRPSVGSHLDTNRRESFAVKEAAFDKEVLRAAAAALGKTDPRAPVSYLLAKLPGHYENHDKLFDGTRLVLPDDIAQAVRGTQATHLLLVTKRRGEARVRTLDATLGSGRFEGLGFYLDHQQPMKRGDTGEHSIGFLAPFVYVDVSLIDIATLQVLSTVSVMHAVAISAARNKDGADPWGALTPARKGEWMQEALAREVGAAMTGVLKAGR